jgi:hypothetical protein
MVVVVSGWVEGQIVSEQHAVGQRELEVWYGTNDISLKNEQSLLPRMVVVESCGVEGWIVSERHAARQRELEEPLVFFLVL